MKKTIWVVTLTVLALSALGVGVALAQDGQPPFGGRGPMMGNGAGPLHTFMVAAFAEKLDLNAADINTRLANGETMYTIAISEGVTAEEFPALMTDVRTTALDAAVEGGVITQEQADWMKSRGFGQGGNYGNCPMHNGTGTQYGPQNGRGGGGPRWQNPQTAP